MTVQELIDKLEEIDDKSKTVCAIGINPEFKLNRVPHPMSLKPRSQWTDEEKKIYSLD